MANTIGNVGTLASAGGKIAGLMGPGMAGVASVLGPVGAVLGAVSMAQSLFGNKPKRQTLGATIMSGPDGYSLGHYNTKGVGRSQASKFATNVMDVLKAAGIKSPSNFTIETNIGNKDRGTFISNRLLGTGSSGRSRISSKAGDIDAILNAVKSASERAGFQRPAEMELSPAVKQELGFDEQSGISSQQMRSAFATQGVNKGLGTDSQAYYRNLLQRSLIGEGNQVDKTNSQFLMPIESQYFSQQGKNTSDITEFLKSLQG